MKVILGVAGPTDPHWLCVAEPRYRFFLRAALLTEAQATLSAVVCVSKHSFKLEVTRRTVERQVLRDPLWWPKCLAGRDLDRFSSVNQSQVPFSIALKPYGLVDAYKLL